MTRYDLRCAALIDNDAWSLVWPPGVRLGPKPIQQSWAAFVGAMKAVEYFQGAGRWRRFNKFDDAQKDLARRFALIQQQVLPIEPIGFPHFVRLPPLTLGTPFTTETVRADFVAVAGADTPPAPLDRAETVARVTADLQIPGVISAEPADISVGGHPAVRIDVTAPLDGGMRRTIRAVGIYPRELPAVGRLVLQTDVAELVGSIDATLDELLAGATFVDVDEG